MIATKKDLESLKKIRQITSGYWASRVLLSASNYRLFDSLEKPMTAAGLSRKLSLDPRAVEIVLDALCGLGLLRKSGKQYRNTSLSSRFLVKGKPHYQGDILRHHDSLWKRWSELDSVLESGQPVSGERDHGSFIRGMHNIAVLQAHDVVSKIDLTGITKVLDLGGGPGTYSIEFARRGLDVTLCDVQETGPIASEIISQASYKGTIRFVPADFLSGDIGSGYDLVFVSQVLHSYSPENILHLLRRIRGVLHKKGSVAIHEFLLVDDRTEPLSGSLFSVNMLVNTSGGRSYSVSEIVSWLNKAGYQVMKKSFLEQTVVIQARKP